jgi:hypothetical protein
MWEKTFPGVGAFTSVIALILMVPMNEKTNEINSPQNAKKVGRGQSRVSVETSVWDEN